MVWYGLLLLFNITSQSPLYHSYLTYIIYYYYYYFGHTLVFQIIKQI